MVLPDEELNGMEPEEVSDPPPESEWEERKRAAHRRYDKSEKGKIRRYRYERSSKGKLKDARYRMTDSSREVQRRYETRPEVREYRRVKSASRRKQRKVEDMRVI